MKIHSWNVNGIRASVKKGFLEYLDTEKPDILGLQEVKATEGENPIYTELSQRGYSICWSSAQKKGYSGTAVFSKTVPISVVYGIGVPEHDMEGRVICAEFSDFYYVTVYTPNSKDDLSRLPYRQVWDTDFLAYICTLEAKKPVIFAGDLNVAHTDIDLANPRANIGEHGYTEEERRGLQHILDAGYIDSFRHIRGDILGAYTWWSNFAQSRSRNVGWRIDYVFVSPKLCEYIQDARILQHVLGSDHCPVEVILGMKN